MKIGLNVTPLYSGHKSRGIGYYTKNLANYLKRGKDIEVYEFTKISQIKDVQLVHYPWFDLFFHTLPINKIFPTVVTVHDVIPLLFPKQYPIGIKGKFNYYLQRLALKNCRFIITDSLVSKRDIIKYLKIDGRKVEVVPLAIDPKFEILKDTELLKVKMKYGLPEKFLMYAGDANWIKNLPFLIDCFRNLINTTQFREIKLVLVGGVFLKNVENINHPELESLKEVNRKIRDYGLESRIIRPGYIEDSELAAFYNLATVYIQPSLYEGFGLPLLQSFACGTPVISSNAGSLYEVGGRAALYFDPTNINHFISLISEVLQDKSLRSKLSKLGFEQVNKFSWQKTVDQTIDIYKRAVVGNYV